jgi:eukaryotic-like serine/threonine-protein kinase
VTLPARVGRWEVLKPLGKGGMAEVFHVRGLEEPFLNKEFALKRLLPALKADPESVRLFSVEAALSKHLHHPNIVEVHEVGHEGDSIFMVMDFIDGRDAGQILKRCRQQKVQWPIDFAVYLTKALLDALGYAHHATDPNGQPLGLIHCDVSPSNFFVSRTGELKLGDFGVARSLIEGGSAQVMGKPYYLSPEALEGVLTPQADLWAVAVTLYELITLQRPFQGKTPDDVFDAIRHARYVPVQQFRPAVPSVIDGLIARAFDADPQRRYQSAEAFAEALMPLYDERVGTPLAISAVVRGLFGTTD